MDDDAYHQRWMSETGFSLLKDDDGEKLCLRSWHGQFRELTRKCIVHNLSQAASANSPPALFLRRIHQRRRYRHPKMVRK